MTETAPSRLEAVLRRDRIIVMAALVVVVALSWIWVVLGAGMGMSAFDMTRMPRDMVMTPAVWSLAYAALIFAMWCVMMVAMMLPSAAPVLLLFARLSRRQSHGAGPWSPTGCFAAGYLAVWAGFSAAATLLQWALEASGLLSAMLVPTASWLGAAILIAAGLWQLTPLKHVCLRHCRSPLGFLTSRWRAGSAGAFRMGLEHGGWCVGCCWFLMALLFCGGVMNLWWIAGLALYILLEKTVPPAAKGAHWLARAVGVGLVAWGIWLLMA